MFHIAHNATVFHLRFGDETLGDQLSVLTNHHLDVLTHIRQEDVVGVDELRLEVVWRIEFLIVYVRHAVFGHQHTSDIGLLGDGVAQVVDHDKVGIVAPLQQSHVEFVMPDGVERGGPQHVHHIVT